jgi:hypothetical protein
MNKRKKYDAVKMMREIRDELSNKYNRNPEQQQKDLQAIRKKYNFQKDFGIKPYSKV